MVGALLTVLFLCGVGVVGHQKGDADASSEKTAMDEEAVRTLSAQVNACGPSDAESFILVLQVTVSS